MSKLRSLLVVSAAALCGFSFLQGCGNSSSDTNGAASATPAATTAPDPSTAAITNAASDFLDAVLKGDSQRASARLTPQAMQRIVGSGIQFAPTGLSNATFRIGEVRSPAVDKAFVHAVLTDTTTAGGHSEEMCCLMRRVDNDWRVSGIAYWSGPGQNGAMSDFETGHTTPIPRDPAMTGAPSTAPGGTTPGFPPRMAQEPAAGAPR
jgi:hypothetical protein